MKPLNQRQLADALGVSSQSIIEWRKAGIIKPTIHEGYVIRFDLESVKQQLADRAKSNASNK